MYREKTIRISEALQLIILNNLYALSGTERIIFQGGTALRWIYGGTRFSEDLDFVADLSAQDIQNILDKAFNKVRTACTAQFGTGVLEIQPKHSRRQAAKTFFIYRPEARRERIAVRVEIGKLQSGQIPDHKTFVLRDLPAVSGLVTRGDLVIPYSSSVALVETPEEIFSDKIRALFERKYLKGRDIYDIWWLVKHLNVVPKIEMVKAKLLMYETTFTAARAADYFQKDESTASIKKALDTDLPRFIPQNILSVYQRDGFKEFINTLKEVTSDLLSQGMKDLF